MLLQTYLSPVFNSRLCSWPLMFLSLSFELPPFVPYLIRPKGNSQVPFNVVIEVWLCLTMFGFDILLEGIVGPEHT